MSGWFESATGLVLLEPFALVLVLLVGAALWIRRRGEPSVTFAPAPLVQGSADGPAAPVTLRARLRRLPMVLQALALVLAAVALARPAHRERVSVGTEGIDVLLCLDVSSSMTSNDLDPRRTRLEVARAAASEFVAGRPNDRVGLVSFARYPDLRCPPTLDHDALRGVLERVAPVKADGPEDATGIGGAVARAAQVLRGADGRSRVVVLLTDGEENVATAGTARAANGEIPPSHAARLCAELGVRVYTIAVGIGSRGPGGAIVPLDTRALDRLATVTGGRAFTARDAAAVSGVYAEIDALERAEFREPRYRFDARHAGFVAAAVLLVLVARLLAATWPGGVP